jgi:hypothetical protein
MRKPKLKIIRSERPLIALTGRFLIPRRQLRQALQFLGYKVIAAPRSGSVLIVGRDPGSVQLAAAARSVPCYSLLGFIWARIIRGAA